MHSLDAIVADFRAQEQWLLSLITDPDGARFATQRTPAAYRRRDLERVARTADFMSFIGNPQRQLRAVHIAGTSGKGSVTTLIAALLTACGLRTADHVSPYLQLCLEKLRIDGQMIAPSEFAHLVREFRRLHGAWLQAGGDLRYGEAWVALTLLWFAHKRLDWVVMETGRGGRFDPTIVMPAELAVITNVAFDHVATLGPTLRDIAWHKAGIIRPNTPVLTAATQPEVLDVIRREAEQKRAPLFELDYRVNADGSLTVNGPYQQYDDVQLGPRAGFQNANAALAIAAVDVLAHEFGVALDGVVIERALRGVAVPGRFEQMQSDPVVILDSAHNPHKTQALAASVAARFPDRPLTVVMGVIARKEADGMVEALRPIADRFIATQPHVFGKPGQPPDRLAQRMRAIAPDALVTTADSINTALDGALGQAARDEIILVTGSIYLVGAARERWVPSGAQLRQAEQARHAASAPPAA